jgi:hypothetical protein
MAVRFNPEGLLDVATDPSDLPSQVVGKVEVSGAMQRCTNLHLDQKGVAKTRLGSTKLNATPLTGVASELIEELGDRYAFTPGYIYKNEVALSSGLSIGQWSAIVYNAYNSLNRCIFATNGEDRKRIEKGAVYEWGIDAPNNPPKVQAALNTDYSYDTTFDPLGTVPGGLTGAYKAVYTYCRKEAEAVVCESNPSPEQSAVTLSAQALGVTFTWPSDPQVTHVRIYRTTAGGLQYYWNQDVVVNPQATATVASYAEDTELGSEVSYTNNRPPVGSMCFGPTYNGYCFIANGNKLYFCKPRQPELWPLNYYIECGPPQYPIRSLTIWGGSIWVMTDIEVYQIQGTGYQSFFPVPMKCPTGTRGRRALDSVKGGGMYHWGMDGVYAYTGTDDEKMSERLMGPIFKGESRGSIDGIDRTYLENCIIFAFKSKVWLGFPSVGATYPDNWIVFNMAAGDVKTLVSAASPRISHYDYGKEFSVLARDNTNNRILAADTDGYIWVIDDPAASDDEGTAIAWEIESKSFSDQYASYFPRYAKYDVALDDTDSTATGKIVLDEEVRQLHSIVTSRKSRMRLITGCTGKRMSVRLTGTGAVTIYGVEVE